MAYKRKTWREKLADKNGLPKIIKLEERYPCYQALHRMGAEAGDDIVLVNPREVVDLMRAVPPGKVTTIDAICRAIATRYQVRGCCPLTAGIFIMTAARAVEETMGTDDTFDVPYWRTLKTDGYLNEKFPGGAAGHKQLLENEGFKVVARGKRFCVQDYRDYLADLGA